MNIRNNKVLGMHFFYINFTRDEFTIMEWLKNRGYTLSIWAWKFEDETFPNGISLNESKTFVALKPGETPSEDKIYTAVFEREIRKLLNDV